MRSDAKDRVLKENEAFFAKIIEKIKSGNIDEVKLMVGSARQSKPVDDNGQPQRGSCFTALEDILAYFKEHITKNKKRSEKNVEVNIDGYLLADLYGNCEAGENFKNAIAILRKENNNSDYSFSSWIYDDSKVTLIYAQMHKIALQNPQSDIIYDFYDDRMGGENDILNNLHEFFTKHHNLVPKNLTLRFHHYKGGDVYDYETIKGTGNIDKNFERSVKVMAFLSGAINDGAPQFVGKVDIRKHLDLEENIDKFISWPKEGPKLIYEQQSHSDGSEESYTDESVSDLETFSYDNKPREDVIVATEYSPEVKTNVTTPLLSANSQVLLYGTHNVIAEPKRKREESDTDESVSDLETSSHDTDVIGVTDYSPKVNTSLMAPPLSASPKVLLQGTPNVNAERLEEAEPSENRRELRICGIRFC